MGLPTWKKTAKPESDFVVPLPRMVLKPPVAVQQIKTSPASGVFFGYAVNLTREGLFVPTLNPRPIGFRTKIRFQLPKTEEVIEGTVEVVWQRAFDPRQGDRPAGMGLKFVDLSETKKSAIDAFMGLPGVQLRP